MDESDESNDGMKHGSLVDDLLTDQLTGSKSYKEKYYLYDGNKPTATLGNLCDIILKNYESIPDLNTVLKIVRHNAFWSVIKDDDKLIEKFNLPKFWEYLKVMYETVDKKVITTSDNLAAREAVNVLLTHEYSKHLYFNKNDNYYQMPFEIGRAHV